MTSATASTARVGALTTRLNELRTERAQTMAELVSNSGGDAADRATNVDANVRFAMLEQRIAAVEIELSNDRTDRASNGGVMVGDVVTVDFGDGPETFLFGSVEQAQAGLEVITPTSPLGLAIDGAQVGAQVSYTTGARRTMSVRVVVIS